MLVRDWLFTGASKNLPGGVASVGYPPVNSEYFEWLGLLAAVVSAQSKFTMVELGAGWGRWLIAGAKLAQARQLPVTLAGIEADPDHFRWMQDVFRDNGLDPEAHCLSCVAAAARGGQAAFLRQQDPARNYGQRLVSTSDAAFWKTQPGCSVVQVRAKSLEEILGDFDSVDFLSLDVSGDEAEILSCGARALDRVRVLQVATGTAESDRQLELLLQTKQWLNVFRFPPQTDAETADGPIRFYAGLQTWVHPEAAGVRELIDKSSAGAAYPMTGVPEILPSGGGGTSVFDTEAAQEINAARMAHLQSLGLPIEGRRVLDVGCGVGHLAQFFVSKNCGVLCTDARAENVAALRERYPNLPARVSNVEADSLEPLGRFDVVFCYGLLYHLENPLAALRNMAAVCDDLLLLETVVLDAEEPLLRLVDEPAETFSQAVGGLASRPSPAFVAMALTRAGFPFIYVPRTPPRHPDFLFDWKNNHEFARDGHLLRCIFVASRRPLDLPELILQFSFSAETWDPDEETRLLSRARELVQFRDLLPYPGWHFDIDWEQPDAALQERRSIWEMFRSAGKIGLLEVEWHDGVRLALYLGNDLSKQLFVTGCFEPNEFAFLNRFLRPGMRFVDAGANDGLYSLFAARNTGESGRVYAFEPSLRELERLRHNAAVLNHFVQVEIFPFALSDQEGMAGFSVAAGEHAGQNTLGTLAANVKLESMVEAPTRRLDDLAKAEHWDRIDVIKIDVEGAEAQLIRGAAGILRTMRPVLLFECSEAALRRNGSSREELVALIRSFHYDLYRFDETTGLPVRAGEGAYSDNMIAAPMESPLAEGG